jgi:biopolymer transport protein ExbB/TolQ
MPCAHRTDLLAAVRRVSAGSAKVVHSQLERGLHILASIAFSAPLVGVIGTLLGILNSFPGFIGDKDSHYALVNERLSESLMPIELGLLVAMLAFCGHKYLSAKLDDFDIEMDNTSFLLASYLTPLIRCDAPHGASEFTETR